MKQLFLCALVLGLASCSSSQGLRRSSAPKAPTRSASMAGPAPVAVNDSASPARAQELLKNGKVLEALRDFVTLSVSAPVQSDREMYRAKALEVIETRLNNDGLQKVSENADFGYLRGYALYQMGVNSLTAKDTDSAKKYFTSVVSFLPGSDLAFQAETQLATLESSRYVESKTIGVVLPLSGRNSAIGQRALRGVEMGLGIHEPGANFKLAVMDSEGNPDRARRGVERLVKEDNVIAIVGSLLSRTAPAVASKAAELNVPTLALSQRTGLTDIGPSVFRNSLTSGMQVRELVRTAMDEMGMRRFAILYPNDAYGVEYANLFWDEVLARGGQINAVQMYNPKDTDFRPVVQRLVGSYYIEGRYDEFNFLSRDLVSDPKRKKSIRQQKSGDDVLSPIVDFDAVFIPDSAKAMGQLSAFLSYSGVKNIHLLGTNLWNGPGLAKRAGLFSDRLLFVDSYMPTANEAQRPRFVREYKRLFGEDPSLIEIQAYDSALILRTLILQGAGSRESLTRQLTDLRNFPGSLGPLKMDSTREVRRPVVAMTLQKGESVIFTKPTKL